MHSRKAGIIAALLLSFDFMHFTYSRLALIDGPLALFITLEYFAFYKYYQLSRQGYTLDFTLKYWLISGIALGLGAATKWPALFSLPLIISGIAITERNRQPNWLKIFAWAMLCFVAVPLGLYILSYLPYLWSAHPHNLLEFVFQLQIKTYNFHTHIALELKNGHESPWWSWPLIMVPYSIYYQVDPQSIISSSLVLMGNPAIWWFGTLAVILVLLTSSKLRDGGGFYIVAMIACQYLPFAFIHRSTYIYYFYAVTPFMILAIVYTLQRGFKRSEVSIRMLCYMYLVLVVALFCMFYPALAGLELPRVYVYKYLMWYRKWVF
jgi:dolichyl-phosphate-mannose--protein O-mannosyl transferase